MGKRILYHSINPKSNKEKHGRLRDVQENEDRINKAVKELEDKNYTILGVEVGNTCAIIHFKKGLFARLRNEKECEMRMEFEKQYKEERQAYAGIRNHDVRVVKREHKTISNSLFSTCGLLILSGLAIMAVLVNLSFVKTGATILNLTISLTTAIVVLGVIAIGLTFTKKDYKDTY